MKKTIKPTTAKSSKKEVLKSLLKECMPGCFYSTVREGYNESKVDELVERIENL